MTDTQGPWHGRTGEFSPTYYAQKGPDETSERLRELLVEHVGRDAAVLELGCNVGRHLAHLHADGFSDLTGVDLNQAAIDALGETYPDLAAAGRFVVADLVDFLACAPTGSFDAVYSVETLQHVAPADVGAFDNLARIASGLLVTVENEGGVEGTGYETTRIDDISLYHRDWATVFTDREFRAVLKRQVGRDTLRAFRA